MSKSRNERREALLKEAMHQFSEHGYAHTSLAMIVERTGGSRRDFYDFFGGKEGLLKEVLQDTMAKVLKSTEQLAAQPGDTPDIVLRRFGCDFISRMLAPEVLAAFREFAVIKTDHPNLARAAYEMGPAVLYGRVAAYLEKEVAAGRLSIPDPQRAARILVEAFKGEFQLRQMMGAASPPSPEDIETHVETVVSLFFSGQIPDTTPRQC